MSTKEMRDEWQRLSDAATAGKWRHRQKLDNGTEHHDVLSTGDDWQILVHGGSDCSRCASVPVEPENAAFIAAAREAVPALLQDVERLTAALEDARAGICTIYHLIDSDKEIKAMKHCKNVTDPIDAALASVRK